MPGRLPVMPVRIIAYTIAYHVGLPPTILNGRLRNERHNGTTAQRHNGQRFCGWRRNEKFYVAKNSIRKKGIARITADA